MTAAIPGGFDSGTLSDVSVGPHDTSLDLESWFANRRILLLVMTANRPAPPPTATAATSNLAMYMSGGCI